MLTNKLTIQKLYPILFIILSFFVCWGYSYLELQKNVPSDFSNNPEYFFIFGITYYFLYKLKLQYDKRLFIFSSIGGILLSISYVFGIYLHYKNFLFGSKNNIFIIFLLVLSLLAFTIPFFSWLLKQMSTISSKFIRKKDTEEYHHKITNYFARFFIYWISIFAFFIPVFLVYWPGNFIFDAKYQLKEVISNAYSVHHPLIHTWLMGFFYNYGDTYFANVSKGFSFYTILQMTVISFSFAYCQLFFYKREFPKGIRTISYLFFTIFPVNILFSITATKDVLFSAFFLLFIVIMLELIYKIKDSKIYLKVDFWLQIIGLLLAGTFMILFRNNAKYAYLLMIPLFLLFKSSWKNKLIVFFTLIAILISSSGINHMMIKTLDAVDRDSSRETLSVPLQQLGRVVAYLPEELDAEMYHEITSYIEEGRFSSYNPYLSDPIKNTANEELLETNLSNFLKLWIKVGMQFPEEYADSFLTNTMGFWYLGDVQYRFVYDLAAYHTLIDGDNIQQIEKHDYFPLAGVFYNWFYTFINHRTIPIVSYLFNSALYSWVLIFTLLYSFFKKNNKYLIPFSLLFFYLLSCFFGPTVMLRYIYCLVVCIPLILTLLLDPKKLY